MLAPNSSEYRISLAGRPPPLGNHIVGMHGIGDRFVGDNFSARQNHHAVTKSFNLSQNVG